ncbi:hypothetical protein CRE_29922 [Caenorhabditis remanei]|uniref:Uncharacterized protein n=1 Tax=Caenorhabditis remanei TaxID=31234 RepID=E3MM74_CAERE|nr:hypothetical protein CRE_29922 [Caenorhabditis remanei]
MSVILSIFCLSCRKPYGNILILIAWIHLNITDEVSRRPRLGSCFHIICEECQNKRNDDTCQVCGKENAFEREMQNYGLVGMWEDIVKSMSAEQYFENHVTKPKKVTYDRCSTQNCTGEVMRFCATCAVTCRLGKKNSNGSFGFFEVTKAIQVIDKCLTCIDCMERIHQGHEFKKLSEIGMITEKMEKTNSLIHGVLLETKLNDEEEKKGRRFGLLTDHLYVYKRSALSHALIQQYDNMSNIEKQIMLANCVVNIHNPNLPEISEAKQKAFQLAKTVYEKTLKLKERRLIFEKEEIDLYRKFVQNLYEKSNDDKELKDLSDGYTWIAKKFEEISITHLKEEEIERIDEETDEKMARLVAICRENEPTDEENLEKFYKWRALKKEKKESEQELELSHRKLSDETRKFRNIFLDRYETLNEIEKEFISIGCSGELLPIAMTEASKLFLLEITDRSFVVDKALIAYIEGLNRGFQSILMFRKHFPPSIPRSYEDDIYIQLFEVNDDTDFVQSVFSQYAFNW